MGAKLMAVCRLGRDAELRYSSDGTPVANFSAAYDYGRKGDDGKRPSQWLDLSLWGNRAEALLPYLVKGAQVFVTVDDPHEEKFEKRDGGSGSKLVGRVNDVELVGGRPSEDRSAGDTGSRAPRAQEQGGYRSSAPRRAPGAAAAAPAGGGVEELDDDIPF
jgi:single-strand DNA-binding protein